MGSRSRRIRRSVPERGDDWHRGSHPGAQPLGCPATWARGAKHAASVVRYFPMKTNLVPAALAAILALAFATLAQSQESSGIKSTVEDDAKAVGHAVADGEHDVADKSKEAGHAMAGETKAAGGAIRDDSKKAGAAVSHGAQTVGKTVKGGADKAKDAVSGKKADEPEPKN